MLPKKGVDMRIGLDMARLALRDMVRTIIVVTGDPDFVPAFKFVRREGVKVILEPMGHNVRWNCANTPTSALARLAFLAS